MVGPGNDLTQQCKSLFFIMWQNALSNDLLKLWDDYKLEILCSVTGLCSNVPESTQLLWVPEIRKLQAAGHRPCHINPSHAELTETN